MTVRSKCLRSPTLLTTTNYTALLVPPAGTTYVVRTILICNAAAVGSANITLGMGSINSGQRIRGSDPVAQGVTLVYQEWLAIQYGLELGFRSSVANVLTVAVFGAELDGVAP